MSQVGQNEVQISGEAEVAQLKTGDRIIAVVAADAGGITGVRTREQRDAEARANAIDLVGEDAPKRQRTARPIRERLLELKDLLDEGLVSQQEFEAARAKILAELTGDEDEPAAQAAMRAPAVSVPIPAVAPVTLSAAPTTLPENQCQMVARLKGIFPSFEDDALEAVLTACGRDMNQAARMLSELEPPPQ